MRRNFSYTLLITWILFAVSCKTNYVPTSSCSQNRSVSKGVSPPNNQVVQIIFFFKNIFKKDIKRIFSFSEQEMSKKKPITNFLADLLLDDDKVEVKKKQALCRGLLMGKTNFIFGCTSMAQKSIFANN